MSLSLALSTLVMSLLLPSPANSLSELWREQRREIPVVRDAADGVHVGYQTRPVAWMVEQLGIPEHTIRWSLNPGYTNKAGRVTHKWDGTPEPLVTALEALAANQWVGVEAGTGTQKTYVLGAATMLWFLGCFENAIVITLAPKEDQLKLLLWKEARTLFPKFKLRFPQATLTDLKLRMRGGLDEAWTATGFVAGVGADEETAGKARGFHAEHALYIFEERPGIHAAIQSAIDFTCTAPHNIQLQYGNPDNQQDGLHEFCQRPDVVAVRISALDHPNVVTGNASIVPGAASRASVNRLRGLHGESSSIFQAKVRGISPLQAVDSLIQWAWCEEAAARYSDPAYRIGLPGLGVDVADSPNGDQASICRGLGACALEIDAFKIGERNINNASQLGEQVALEVQLGGIDGRNVGIDSVGVGASTVNKVTEIGILIEALNGGAAPVPRIDEDVLEDTGKGLVPVELFADLRSQMYWQARMDLQHFRVAMPYDKELFRDLTAVKWIRRGGKIVVEPKEAPTTSQKSLVQWGVRQRLGRSTNKGDSFVYWNWVRHRRSMKIDPTPRSAWDADVLAYEAMEGRRIRTRKPVRKGGLQPSAVEHVD